MAILLDYPNQVAVKNWYTSQDNLKAWMYAKGMYKPNYPMPTVIGFQHTKMGTYMFDTRYRIDGMPLFRGYRIYYNPHMLFVFENECKQGWTWF